MEKDISIKELVLIAEEKGLKLPIFKWDEESIDKYCLYYIHNWLRDNHNIHIPIIPIFYKTGINYLWQILIYDPEDSANDLSYCSLKSTGLNGDNGEYKIPEKALKDAIIKALNLI